MDCQIPSPPADSSKRSAIEISTVPTHGSGNHLESCRTRMLSVSGTVGRSLHRYDYTNVYRNATELLYILTISISHSKKELCSSWLCASFWHQRQTWPQRINLELYRRAGSPIVSLQVASLRERQQYEHRIKATDLQKLIPSKRYREDMAIRRQGTSDALNWRRQMIGSFFGAGWCGLYKHHHLLLL